MYDSFEYPLKLRKICYSVCQLKLWYRIIYFGYALCIGNERNSRFYGIYELLEPNNPIQKEFLELSIVCAIHWEIRFWDWLETSKIIIIIN